MADQSDGRGVMTGDGRRDDLSLADHAQDAIREAILSMRLLPGQQLIESALARELGMSKTPVREALQRLASEGLVVLDRFRGAVVREIDPVLIQHVYEVRELLEPVAVAQAVPNLSADALSDLGALLDQSAAALKEGDLISVARLNRAFHGLLISYADNVFLGGILERIQNLTRVITMVTWAAVDNRWREHEEHLAILEAARRGDAKSTGRLMARHIAAFHEVALRVARARFSEPRFVATAAASAGSAVRRGDGAARSPARRQRSQR